MITIPTTLETEQKFQQLCAKQIELPLISQTNAFQMLTSIEQIMLGAPPFTPKHEDEFRDELLAVISEGLEGESTEKSEALLDKYTDNEDKRITLANPLSDAIVEEKKIKDLDELKWSKQ